MLEEALQFVEPDGSPFKLTIVGHDALHAVNLLGRFAEMLRREGFPVARIGRFMIDSGNTRIIFRSWKDPSVFRNPRTTFIDHTCYGGCTIDEAFDHELERARLLSGT